MTPPAASLFSLRVLSIDSEVWLLGFRVSTRARIFDICMFKWVIRFQKRSSKP
jgi:hypothetical protein